MALLRGIAGLIPLEEQSEVYINQKQIPLPFENRGMIGIASDIETLPGEMIVEDYLNLFNTIREVPAVWHKYHLDLAIRVFSIEDLRRS